MIQVMLNGEEILIAEQATLFDLLEQQQLINKRIAVEMNQYTLPRSQYKTTYLKQGDQLEIVQAIGGG